MTGLFLNISDRLNVHVNDVVNVKGKLFTILNYLYRKEIISLNSMYVAINGQSKVNRA